MPRKGPAPKRPVIIDPVYGSPLVTSLINKVLLNGKRSTAERIVYGAMEEGLKFAIREGGRTVGAGQVTKINK